MRVRVHVHPGAKHAGVGGSYGGALVVRVHARAREGAATSGVLEALAVAFGVSKADIALVRGARSRSKLIEIHGDDDALDARLGELLQVSPD